jgi:hypothetical protein
VLFAVTSGFLANTPQKQWKISARTPKPVTTMASFSTELLKTSCVDFFLFVLVSACILSYPPDLGFRPVTQWVMALAVQAFGEESLKMNFTGYSFLRCIAFLFSIVCITHPRRHWSRAVRHDRPFTLSSANAGPSSFFVRVYLAHHTKLTPFQGQTPTAAK